MEIAVNSSNNSPSPVSWLW